jgi:hypothetical protein
MQLRVDDLHVRRLAQVVAKRRIAGAWHPVGRPSGPAERLEDRAIRLRLARGADVPDDGHRADVLVVQAVEQPVERLDGAVDPADRQ